MNRSEKDHEERVSKPLLDATFPPEPNRYLSEKRRAGSRLSRLPLTTKWKIGKLENCRYVGMISPDITISNHRLRWAVDGMRFTAPCC